jgi:hypothetical protein
MTFDEALTVLGVQAGTDSDEVRAAYLARAREIALSSGTESSKAAANERLESAYSAYLAGPSSPAIQVPQARPIEPPRGAPSQYYVPSPTRPRRRWGCGMWLLILLAIMIAVGVINAATQSTSEPSPPIPTDTSPPQTTPTEAGLPGSGTTGQTGLVGSCWEIDALDSTTVRQVDCSAPTVDLIVTSESTSMFSCPGEYLDNGDGYFLCLNPM